MKLTLYYAFISRLRNLEMKLNTYEYIIECFNDNSKDYHQQMNFEKFIKYFENRLVHSCNNLNNIKNISE